MRRLGFVCGCMPSRDFLREAFVGHRLPRLPLWFLPRLHVFRLGLGGFVVVVRFPVHHFRSRKTSFVSSLNGL